MLASLAVSFDGEYVNHSLHEDNRNYPVALELGTVFLALPRFDNENNCDRQRCLLEYGLDHADPILEPSEILSSKRIK